MWRQLSFSDMCWVSSIGTTYFENSHIREIDFISHLPSAKTFVHLWGKLILSDNNYRQLLKWRFRLAVLLTSWNFDFRNLEDRVFFTQKRNIKLQPERNCIISIQLYFCSFSSQLYKKYIIIATNISHSTFTKVLNFPHTRIGQDSNHLWIESGFKD